MTTVARWMHACGFKYKKREKHYFVDGHQRPETIAYRPVFTKGYLDLEIRAHRWLQITLEKSIELEASKNLAINCGFNYVTPDDGVAMVEYHIDSSTRTFFMSNYVSSHSEATSVSESLSELISLCLWDKVKLFLNSFYSIR